LEFFVTNFETLRWWWWTGGNNEPYRED